MSLQTNKDLWAPWVELWNGKVALAKEIIAPDFIANYVPLTGSGGPTQMHGPEELIQWIRQIEVILHNLTFTTEIGPITEGDMLIGRWEAQGTYQGGMPGAPSSSIGKLIKFTGTDSLRIAHGKIAEWWGNADSLYLMQQIGVVPTIG